MAVDSMVIGSPFSVRGITLSSAKGSTVLPPIKSVSPLANLSSYSSVSVAALVVAKDAADWLALLGLGRENT